MNDTAAASLSTHQRLKSQDHFRAVYQHGRRAGGKWMTVVVLRQRSGPGSGSGAGSGPASTNASRLGVSVSKDHGGAVRRNKLKRLLREAFRLERERLPAALDVVLIPRQRAENFPLEALRQELLALVPRALQGGDRRRPPRP